MRTTSLGPFEWVYGFDCEKDYGFLHAYSIENGGVSSSLAFERLLWRGVDMGTQQGGLLLK